MSGDWSERISATLGVPLVYLDTHPPSEVVDGFLWLGSQYNAADEPALRALGITHVLNCAREVPDLFRGQGIEYLHLPWFDNDTQKLRELPAAVAWLRAAREREGCRVLVHCQCGISRSPTAVAAFLVAEMGMRPQEALDLVRAKRPVARPNINFRTQLFRYAAELPLGARLHGGL
eukprot:TRINITY_DN5451_c0_g3_i1.p2 TRINITY_DN5451_c0_g3~~TRINITY_DN5451_c0_g3_i1.p2  ORF type:complete len:176 (+),score=51.34 TRINITY_DN5451_c0_g3_i1:303-830(+)